MTGYVLCDENRCLCKGMRGSFFPCLLIYITDRLEIIATLNRGPPAGPDG